MAAEEAAARPRTPPVVVGLGEILWDMLPEGRRLGGAPANFAFHANALGAQGIVVSQVGSDDLGREILEALDSLGMEQRWVSTDPHHPTGVVHVQIHSHGQPEFTICENVAWDHIPFSQNLAEVAATADVICFGTLCQRSPVSRQTIREVLDHARPQCLRVFDINLRQHYWDLPLVEALLGRCDVLKMNENELAVLAPGLRIESGGAAALVEIKRRYGLRLVALTRGAAGSLLLAADDLSFHGGFPIKVVNAVGAGDAFTAALVMGFLEGLDLDSINRDANLLASYVCSCHGAMPALPDEIRQNMTIGHFGKASRGKG